MVIDDDLAEGFHQHNQLTRKFGTHSYELYIIERLGGDEDASEQTVKTANYRGKAMTESEIAFGEMIAERG